MKKKTSKNHSSVLQPLFENAVSAGFPSPADDYIENHLDLNRLIVKNPASTFFVKVSGDSMKNAGIFPGDILAVDRSLKASHGKIVVAILNGEFTVKRLQIDSKKQISLLPENPTYPPIKIYPGSDFQVWGVVTYVIHKPI